MKRAYFCQNTTQHENNISQIPTHAQGRPSDPLNSNYSQMKQIITTVFFLFLFVGVATAQHFNIGVKGGINAYTTAQENISKVEPKLGLHLGLMGHAHLSRQFALQPELVFSMQGSRYTASGNDVNLSLNYINIPLLLQYMYDNGFRLQAGPQIGILASAKAKTNNTTVDVKDDLQTLDIGLGVGMSYVNPATDFGFDVRYNHGLSNINKNKTSGNYNRGFQVGVFYLINHK